PAQTAAVSGNGFVLQLASLKSKERAPLEWIRLQKSFPSLLGGRQLVVLPADLGDRGTFYRVQAGFFPDRASAEAVCKQLKAKSQDCLVMKR
ncbi:MAG: SPOR domain-containing protein, partial [Alphaproteobacteria bacterium]